mmetsp:Transcript_51354/g.124453  ORF Transcript_51354/g.124453 Transcript_51354/m.124453 type:complete len:316 (-) Transcript_51354:435-1382(-)
MLLLVLVILIIDFMNAAPPKAPTSHLRPLPPSPHLSQAFCRNQTFLVHLCRVSSSFQQHLHHLQILVSRRQVQRAVPQRALVRQLWPWPPPVLRTVTAFWELHGFDVHIHLHTSVKSARRRTDVAVSHCPEELNRCEVIRHACHGKPQVDLLLGCLLPPHHVLPLNHYVPLADHHGPPVHRHHAPLGILRIRKAHVCHTLLEPSHRPAGPLGINESSHPHRLDGPDAQHCSLHITASCPPAQVGEVHVGPAFAKVDLIRTDAAVPSLIDPVTLTRHSPHAPLRIEHPLGSHPQSIVLRHLHNLFLGFDTLSLHLV